MYLLLFNKKEKISPFFCSSWFGCLLYAGELWLAIVIVTVNWWQSALSCSVGLPLVGGLGQPLWEGRGTGQNKVGYIIRIKSILLHTKVKETANVRLFCCWSISLDSTCQHQLLFLEPFFVSSCMSPQVLAQVLHVISRSRCYRILLIILYFLCTHMIIQS